MDATTSRPAGRRPKSGKSPEALRTIGEVAEELQLPPHVLRYWETQFSRIKPMKRSGGRRLYRPSHVALIRGIRALLYDDGMTIRGVQKVLREKGAKAVIARGDATIELTIERSSPPSDAAGRLAALRARVEAERTAKAAEEGELVSPQEIRTKYPGLKKF